jgi:nicotinamide mononucleotide adenylyltransferase
MAKYTGLFIGRFQPFHNGHLAALKEIEKVLLTNGSETNCEIIIAVGNNREIDYRHWWTFEQVKEMIEPCIQGFKIPIRIEYIPDLNDPPHYAEYVITTLKLEREEIDLTVFSGNSDTLECFRDKSWCSHFKVWIYRLKEIDKIFGCKHGTELRMMMAFELMTGLQNNWKDYVPEPVRKWFLK